MHQCERTYLIVTQPGERGDPIVPHSVDCDGYLIVEEHGKMADLKCNSCSAVVDTVPLKRAGQRLMQLALVEISSALCPYCGTTNALAGYNAVEAFICCECGEGVNVKRWVQ
jgi:hypothetical protein